MNSATLKAGLEMGSSSRLCATWKLGGMLVVMGVTGTATEIPKGRTVLLVRGGLGNGNLGETSIPLNQVDHMIVIGSDRMMAAVKEARHGWPRTRYRKSCPRCGWIICSVVLRLQGQCLTDSENQRNEYIFYPQILLKSLSYLWPQFTS